ncbi:MAG: hypothetical protein NC826_04965 [Candidatus Omnitrophica bacterium]|nr:hypothetical protein [Candidatus Omnitrophota bacterium]
MKKAKMATRLGAEDDYYLQPTEIFARLMTTTYQYALIHNYTKPENFEDFKNMLTTWIKENSKYEAYLNIMLVFLTLDKLAQK